MTRDRGGGRSNSPPPRCNRRSDIINDPAQSPTDVTPNLQNGNKVIAASLCPLINDAMAAYRGPEQQEQMDNEERATVAVGVYGDIGTQSQQKAFIEGTLITKGKRSTHYSIVFGPNKAIKSLENSQLYGLRKKTLTFQPYEGRVGNHFATITSLTDIPNMFDDDESIFDNTTSRTSKASAIAKLKRDVIPIITRLIRSNGFYSIVMRYTEDSDNEGDNEGLDIASDIVEVMASSVSLSPTRASETGDRTAWVVKMKMPNIPALINELHAFVIPHLIVTKFYNIGKFNSSLFESCFYHKLKGWSGTTPDSIAEIVQERKDQITKERAAKVQSEHESHGEGSSWGQGTYGRGQGFQRGFNRGRGT
ncbi:hypothetical protein C8J56DRAFT_899281 [Mycena floridula]|nr:hypothetical protein C8J56DRAFT_899281 [Mycena floridula]